MKNKVGYIDNSDMIPVESFSATMKLRWVLRETGFDSNTHIEKVLQQAWQGSHGTIEWRDIETVYE